MKQVLDFAKAHAIALSCAVVAVLALVAYFIYPIPSLFGQLQTNLDERKQVYESLNTLKTSSRTLPKVEVDAAEPKPLTQFPTERVIKSGQEAITRLGDQANQTLGAVVKMNQRPLLVPNSLPRPTPLARQAFLERYKSYTAQYGEAAKSGIIAEKLKGVLPPSEQEIRDTGEQIRNQIMKNDLQIGANGQAVNQAQVEQTIAERLAKLPLEQRVYRALNAQIYVSPGAVDVDQQLQTTTEQPNDVTIFNAQYHLWVQSAVFEAIAAANAGSQNVLTSPVKHLVRLDTPLAITNAQAGGGGGGFFNPGAPPAEGEGAAAAPELKPDASTPLTLNYTSSPLGFTSNNMFDPVPAVITIRVDSRRLTEVLAAMQGGQLLKIKNVNYRAVNMGRALQEGYVYDKDGSTPMVEVILDCDVLMLRSWIVPYMPDPVKAHFAALSNPTPAS